MNEGRTRVLEWTSLIVLPLIIPLISDHRNRKLSKDQNFSVRNLMSDGILVSDGSVGRKNFAIEFRILYAI